MKKIFLLTILFFQMPFAFGQTKTENKKVNQGLATGDYKPNRQATTSANKTTNYESRSYQNDCYKNFAFTVKNYGYNKDGKFYSWGVAVKNNYSKAVQLKYKLIIGNDNGSYGTLTYYIKPSETYSNDFGAAKAIIVNNNSDQYKIEVSDVCFEGQDCIKNGYVDCNGKQLLKTTLNSANNTNSQQNSVPTSNNSQGNDKYSMGVPKEYTGNMALNFDFKNLFNNLSADVTIESVKQFFLNSGFKLCENCYQGDDYASLAKNNESFKLYVKSASGGGKRISIQIPKVCPNLIALFQNWIQTDQLVPFKSKKYGLHFVYQNKYDLWTSNDNSSQWIDWTWEMLPSWDLSKFLKETESTQAVQKTGQVKSVQVFNSQNKESNNLANETSKSNFTVGKEPSFNLGKIKNGKDFIHIFDLAKDIKSISANCGCVSAEISKNHSNAVAATFHGIANYKGPFVKGIVVTYADGATETLYIKGELQ